MPTEKNEAAVALGKLGGAKRRKMPEAQRVRLARAAARARWGERDTQPEPAPEPQPATPERFTTNRGAMSKDDAGELVGRRREG